MDVDAYDIVAELISLSHQFGESIADSIELWISVSFAVIGAAYFAPDRLNPIVAAFLIAIYVAFTAHTFASTDADIRAGQAMVQDAKRIAEERGLQLDVLDIRASGDPADTQGAPWASRIFIFGLFLGVLVFVSVTSFQTYRKRRKPSGEV